MFQFEDDERPWWPSAILLALMVVAFTFAPAALDDPHRPFEFAEFPYPWIAGWLVINVLALLFATEVWDWPHWTLPDRRACLRDATWYTAVQFGGFALAVLLGALFRWDVLWVAYVGFAPGALWAICWRLRGFLRREVWD